MRVKKKEKMFLVTQNVSDKIKNEIIPLLNGSDEEVNDLDDEVAMISNKKTSKKIKKKDTIFTEDIKIEMKE